MNYLAGTFNINMLQGNVNFNLIRMKSIEPKEIPKDVECYIGNEHMARVVENVLGYELKCKKHGKLTLSKEDVLYVANYKGPCITKGETELSKGAELEFLEITVQPDGCELCGMSDCRRCVMFKWTHGN